MSDPRLRLCRSVLFFPASNRRAADKARQLDADMLILDCEDAVKPDDKEEARSAAIEALATGFGNRVTALRINGVGQPWHDADLAAAAQCSADYVVLPKAERRADAELIADRTGKPVLAMIETAAGVLAAPDIARTVAGLITGTNDLAADLGLPPGSGRQGLTHSLQAIVLAARAGGIAAYDGVYNQLDDEAGLAAQCREARAFGFDGKTLIHPSQIATANLCFSPTSNEIEAALRLIDAASGGAERFEGRMVEAMHVTEARAVLAKARLAEP